MTPDTMSLEVPGLVGLCPAPQLPLDPRPLTVQLAESADYLLSAADLEARGMPHSGGHTLHLWRCVATMKDAKARIGELIEMSKSRDAAKAAAAKT